MKLVESAPLKAFVDGHSEPGVIPVAVPSDLVRDYLLINEHMVHMPGERFRLRWPVAPPVIVTQAYGIHRQWYIGFGLQGHEGLDIRALTGTPVMAMADGIVYLVQPNPASGPYGVQVRLRHEFGVDVYQTVYAHFTKGSIRVLDGQKVEAGDVLGLADNTGNSTGPHLHITLKHVGKGSPWMHVSDIVNPVPYFDELFPGKGWLVDVGGNLREEPRETAAILGVVKAGLTVQARDFGGEGGDWWQVRIPGGALGWWWNPGYKARAL